MSHDPQQPQQPGGEGSYPPPGQYPQGGSSNPSGSPYGATPYPAPPPGYGPQPPHQSPKNGMGIAALVLGILSLALVIFGGFPGIILGILAIIFGAVGMSRAKKGQATNRGMAIAGLVTGAIGLVIGVVILVYAVKIAADCDDELGPNASDSAIEACIQDGFGN